MQYPKLFSSQPEITPELLENLEKKGFIVPATSINDNKLRVAEVTNPTAGDVVGYVSLSVTMRNGLSQTDAQALVVIEATRKGGPRESHINRLISFIFNSGKKKVKKKVEEWAKNQK